MAALAACGRKSTNLAVLRCGWALIRLFSASAESKALSNEQDFTADDKKQEKDPLAVLKALASTVEPAPLAPPKELFEDVLLLPNSPRQREECKAAQISGRKAAEYVISKYPQLFPMRKPVPAWPDPKADVISTDSEQGLKAHIKDLKPIEAMAAYNHLTELGVLVSLETQNELLDLVGFFNTSVEVKDLREDAEVLESSSSSSSDSGSSSSDESSDNEQEVSDTTWKMDNHAEQLFSKMETKNARTYEAMILSLIKHNNYHRAFELFAEMRKKNLQANVYTYTALLNKCVDRYGRGKQLWKAVNEEIIDEMKKEPAVEPNLAIYNELLKICGFAPKGTEKAMLVFRDLHHKGIEPSMGSFSWLLRAEYYMKRTRALDAGTDPSSVGPPNNTLLQNIINHLEKLASFPEIQSTSDVKFFNTAIGAAMFCRDGNAAHRLMALVNAHPTKYLGAKRGQFYASYLATLAQSDENPMLVYKLYKDLVPSKLLPQPWVYTELLRMADRAKLPRLVPRFYDDMKRYRVPVEQRACRGIFSALSRKTDAGHYKEYVAIMTDVMFWMKKFEIPIDAFMISQLVRQYSSGGQLQQAWEAYEMFEERNLVPTYSALTGLLHVCKIRRDAKKAVEALELLAKYGYNLHMRKRSEVYDYAHVTLAERMRVNALFQDFDKLEETRETYRKQRHMAKEKQVGANRV